VLQRRKLANGDDDLPLFAGKTGKVRDWKNVYHELKRLLPPDLVWVALYTFRHFFATQAVKDGWAVDKLQKYLGHADIETTLKYYVHVRADEVGPPPCRWLG
jgi:integrase